MTCSSLAIILQGSELYQAPTNMERIWKQHGKILQSKSVSECADQAIWLA